MNIIFVVIAAAAVFALLGLRVTQEYERGVVFRLGRFAGVRGPGLFWIVPYIDRMTRLDLRTRTLALEQQETITRDSVTIKVNAVLWYRIFDPAKAVIAVQNYNGAVYQLALTVLRNLIGQHQLDSVLKERDTINEALRGLVDKAVEPWGIHIEMVEMKDVEIPEAMQRAMAREAEAIREKRARLIKAEAEAEASLKLAEAAKVVAANPAALELRRMQMVSEIGAEHNTTTIVLMPSEMVGMGQALAKLAS